MDKEVIALTVLQGIHSCLAHGFILRAVLDRHALINSGRFLASVTLQGLHCKEEKHEVGLSVDHQILSVPLQVPLERVSFQNARTENRSGTVKGVCINGNEKYISLVAKAQPQVWVQTPCNVSSKTKPHTQKTSWYRKVLSTPGYWKFGAQRWPFCSCFVFRGLVGWLFLQIGLK